MKELRAFQRAVQALWNKTPLGNRPGQGAAAAAKLAEETGEVAKEVLAMEWWLIQDEALDGDAVRERLAAEIGDVLFVVARVANAYQVDLDQTAEGVLERFAARNVPAEMRPTCPHSDRYEITTADLAAQGRRGWFCKDCGRTWTTDETGEPWGQDKPKESDGPLVHDAVAEDIMSRQRFGAKKYGTPLRAFNGRDGLRDAYEEVLDLACYLKQAILEEDAR